jgi:integrase
MTEHNPKKQEKAPQAEMVKIGECLYRNATSGTYYALVKHLGRQIRRSLKTTDKALAQRRLGDFRKSVSRLNNDSEKRHMSFEELGQEWMENAGTRLKASSLRRNAGCLKNLCVHFGMTRINDITRELCETWEKKRGAELSESSFNKESDVLKRSLDYAVDHGYLLENPARHIRHRRVSDKAVIIPTKAEFQKLIASVEAETPRNHEAANLLRLLAYSGMRLGEATRILWREVDFDRGLFTVSGGEIGTKNHQIRVVPLFPVLRDHLLRLREERGTIQPAESIIRVDTAKASLESACQREGLPHFTHHCLRHFFVSNAIEVGVDFKTIAAWIGHKDGGLLVAKTYGHLRDAHSSAMAERIRF